MIAVGDKVRYKSQGKLARLEGKAGKIVTGEVLRIDEEGVTVMPDHRTVEGASFFKLPARIDLSSIRQ